MEQNQKGFSLIELLVVLVVIGFMFYFLIVALNPNAILNRVKNAAIRSDMAKISLSVEGFRSSYDKIPNEQDFFAALKPETIEFEQSCQLLGNGDYECVFLPRAGMLPSACDLSGWRSDGEIGQICHVRYYAGPGLRSNAIDSPTFYRLYAKSWNEDGGFFVYESGLGYYLCPPEFLDLADVESCKKL